MADSTAAALVVSVDGTITDLPLPAENGARLDALRKAIGCDLVDVVRLTTQLDMWVDDDGMFTQRPNVVATLVARRFGMVWQNYHGTVVFAGFTRDGETVGLSRDHMYGLLTALVDSLT